MPSPSCRGSMEPLESKNPDLYMGEGSWKAWRPSSRLSKSSSSSTEPFVVSQGTAWSCLDLASKEPKSLSLESPAVGVCTVEAVWVWVLERAGKRTHSCDCSSSWWSGEGMMVAALSRESLAAGWRIAGAKVDWQNAMASESSFFDSLQCLSFLCAIKTQLGRRVGLGPAKGCAFASWQ